uniref:B30.2/SPRY domain-containing protein n=1 Tax=Nothoprocta perdicaria TaxID=30464 RepID=A0A8C6ZG34_NOTPE
IEMHVTLDPNTANPFLVLAADHRGVKRGDTWALLPDSPERFSTEPCVLGCPSFTVGQHHWEVAVADGGDWWATGVAEGSIRRKGVLQLSPEEGIWALMGHHRVFTAPHPKPLPLNRVPQRIHVLLDRATGQVVFSDADSWVVIFTFHLPLSARERLYPWLWLGEAGTHLRVCT